MNLLVIRVENDAAARIELARASGVLARRLLREAARRRFGDVRLKIELLIRVLRARLEVVDLNAARLDEGRGRIRLHLSADELEARVCAYYGSPRQPHLMMPKKVA